METLYLYIYVYLYKENWPITKNWIKLNAYFRRGIGETNDFLIVCEVYPQGLLERASNCSFGVTLNGLDGVTNSWPVVDSWVRCGRESVPVFKPWSSDTLPQDHLAPHLKRRFSPLKKSREGCRDQYNEYMKFSSLLKWYFNLVLGWKVRSMDIGPWEA